MRNHDDPVVGMLLRHPVRPGQSFVPGFELKGEYQELHPSCPEEEIIVLALAYFTKVVVLFGAEVRVVQCVLGETRGWEIGAETARARHARGLVAAHRRC